MLIYGGILNEHMHSIDSLIPEYMARLRQQGRSANTQRAYIADIKGIARGIRATESGVRELEHRVLANSASAATLNRKICALRDFVRFVNERFNLELALDISARKIDRIVTTPATPEEYQKLVESANDAGNAYRNHALIALMYLQGLKASELSALVCRDVRDKVIVLPEDTVEIEDECRPVLRRYERAFPKAARRPYFQSRSGGAYDTRMIRKIISNLAREAGISMNPSGLRMGYIKNLINGGADSAEVCRKARLKPDRLNMIYKAL